MTRDGSIDPPPADESSAAGESGGRSGEGSSTALEALIRKRKQQGADKDEDEVADNLPPSS